MNTDPNAIVKRLLVYASGNGYLERLVCRAKLVPEEKLTQVLKVWKDFDPYSTVELDELGTALVRCTVTKHRRKKGTINVQTVL